MLRKKLVSFRIFYLDFNYFLKILKLSLLIFIDSIAFYLMWNSDLFLLSIFDYMESISVYSISLQLSTIFFSFSVTLSEFYFPSTMKNLNGNSPTFLISNQIYKVMSVKFPLIIFGLLLFIGFGEKFIFLWLGESFVSSFYISLILIIPISLLGIIDVTVYVMFAMNKQIVKSLSHFGFSIINILLTILSIPYFGIYGAAISTAFGIIFSSFIFIPLYLFFTFKVNVYFMFFKLLLKYTFQIIFMIITIVLLKLFNIDEFIDLFYSSIIYLVTFFSLFYIIQNYFNKKSSISPF
jgi:O-antigen/teichoic acid export membrane protein